MGVRWLTRGWCGVAAWGLVAVATAARADWFVDGPGLPAEACETYGLVEALAMQRAAGGGGAFMAMHQHDAG